MQSNMEKDIQLDLRKVESNTGHLTSAGRTDGHWNSIIRDFHSLSRAVLMFDSNVQ